MRQSIWVLMDVETSCRLMEMDWRFWSTLPKRSDKVLAVSPTTCPLKILPTLVAMDMQKLYVGDSGGLRRLSLREGLRLCGYPDNIKFNVSEKDGFDLLGNTVVVPVIKAVADRLLDTLKI